VDGDPEAFGELFRRHRDRLWAVALRTLHQPDDAADALQEAMISAFRRAAEFRGEAAVTTWLHRIVVNACLDQLRRKAARPTVPADDEAALDALGRRLAGPAPDPASASDAALDVSAALQLLPAGQRAALVLVDMLGYPVSIAAEVLGVSPGTVKSRCARGRARLLPHVAHLRESAQPAAGSRNQTATASVSPSPGTQAPPGAHAAPGPGPGQGAEDRGEEQRASLERRGVAAAPATQPAAEEGRRTGHDRPL
jgi:RNA polymerase sigma-70 factor (ECF subfamily)